MLTLSYAIQGQETQLDMTVTGSCLAQRKRYSTSIAGPWLRWKGFFPIKACPWYLPSVSATSSVTLIDYPEVLTNLPTLPLGLSGNNDLYRRADI